MFNQEEKNSLNRFVSRGLDDDRDEEAPRIASIQKIEDETKKIRKEQLSGEFYWWHAPWGEVKRVTKAEQRELMRQWLESGK